MPLISPRKARSNRTTTLGNDDVPITDDVRVAPETRRTGSENPFNFGADVGTGLHQIAVQAKIYTSTSTQTGEAIAAGTIGKGSVVVTEQRLAGR